MDFYPKKKASSKPLKALILYVVIPAGFEPALPA
jgi:hypothetical protein